MGGLRLAFRRGLRVKETLEDDLITPRQRQNSGSEDEIIPGFDNETLGGYVDYSTLIDPVRGLEGELEGLIIRYDPSLSTSTAQADSNRW